MARRFVRVAIIPQPMSTPTAAGTIAPCVAITDPTVVCHPGVMATDDTGETLTPSARLDTEAQARTGGYERAAVNAVLDEAVVCHVGFVAAHGPVVLPMTYVRIDDDLYLHGAAGNDMLRHLAGDADVCVTVTLLDGLVFARSAFHHSMNYRCVVLFGRPVRVTDPDEMRRASAGLVDHLAPGRSADARPPTPDELRATLMLRLRIDEGSAKVRTGGPIDDAEDLDLDVWAGVVPIGLEARAPVTDGGGARPVAVPPYIAEHFKPGLSGR